MHSEKMNNINASTVYNEWQNLHEKKKHYATDVLKISDIDNRSFY